MAVDVTGNINMVWLEVHNQDFKEIGFSRSVNGGSTWSPAIFISDSFDAYSPRITVDEVGNIYVIWIKKTSSNFIVQFKYSTDGGITWSTPQTITDSPNLLSANLIADTAGNINIFYFKSALRFKRSIDRGLSWQPEIEIPIGPCGCTIAVDQYGNIYLAIAMTNLYFCRSVQ